MLESNICPIKKKRLFEAAQTGNLEVIEQEFSDEYSKTRDEKTDLSIIETAVVAGRANIVKFLLENKSALHNQSIFDFIFEDKQWNILITIIKASNVFNANTLYHGRNNKLICTYLYQLALDEKWEIIELLIERGYELDFNYRPSDSHQSVFDLISYSSNTYSLCEKIVINYEINFCSTNYKCEQIVSDDTINNVLPQSDITPLELAVKNGSHFWVKYLLAHGANERPVSKSDPLEYIALDNKQYEILKFLHYHYRKCYETPNSQIGRFKNISLAWLLARDDQMVLFHEFYEDHLSCLDFNECPENEIFDDSPANQLFFYCLFFIAPEKSDLVIKILKAFPTLNFNIIFKNITIIRNTIPGNETALRNKDIYINSNLSAECSDVTPLWLLASQRQFQTISNIIDLQLFELDFNYSPQGHYTNTSVAWLVADLAENDALMKMILTLPQKIDFHKQGFIGATSKISLLEYFVRRGWLYLIIDHPLYENILPDYFDMALYYGDINSIQLLKRKGIQPKLQLESAHHNFKNQLPTSVKVDCKHSPHLKFAFEAKPDVGNALKKYAKKQRLDHVDAYGYTLLDYCLIFHIDKYIHLLLRGHFATELTLSTIQIAYNFHPDYFVALSAVRDEQSHKFAMDLIRACGNRIKKTGDIIDVPEVSTLIKHHLHYFFPTFLPNSFLVASESILQIILANVNSILLGNNTSLSSNLLSNNILAVISIALNNLCRFSQNLDPLTILYLRANLISIYARYYEMDFSETAIRPLTCQTTKSIVAHLIVIISEIETIINDVTFERFSKDYDSLLNSIRTFSYVLNILNTFIPLFLNVKMKLNSHINELAQDNYLAFDTKCIEFLSDQAFHEILLAYLNSSQRIFSFYFAFHNALKNIDNNEAYLAKLFKVYKDTFKFIDLMQNCYFENPEKLCNLIITSQKFMYDAFLEMFPALKNSLQKPFDCAQYKANITTPPALPISSVITPITPARTALPQKSTQHHEPSKQSVDQQKELPHSPSPMIPQRSQQSHKKIPSKSEHQNKPKQELDDATKQRIAERQAEEREREQAKLAELDQLRQATEAKRIAAEEAEKKRIADRAEKKRRQKAKQLEMRQAKNRQREVKALEIQESSKDSRLELTSQAEANPASTQEEVATPMQIDPRHSHEEEALSEPTSTAPATVNSNASSPGNSPFSFLSIPGIYSLLRDSESQKQSEQPKSKTYSLFG